MTAIESDPSFTFEEYLKFERISDVRHEWVTGQIYAVTGGTERHSLMSQLLFRILDDTAEREGCRAFHADRMIKTSSAAYYPDVIVVCGATGQNYYEEDATWIVEVLSPSTRITDIREKSIAYSTLASLQGYLLVDTKQRLLTLQQRSADGGWTSTTYLPGSQLVMGNAVIDVKDLWDRLEARSSFVTEQ